MLRTLNVAAFSSITLLTGITPALAQTIPGGADPSVCADSHQDPTACRREIGAASRQAPQDPNTDFSNNALRRCEAHPTPEARQACENRIRGQGSQQQGSVAGGGVIHEHRSVRIGPAL